MVFNAVLSASAAEQAAIDGLKTGIAAMEVPKLAHGPELDDAQTLLRFVRGYHLNVKDAVKAFGDMLAWRKANNIDAMREDMYAAAAESTEELLWPHQLKKFEPLVACTGGGLMRRIGTSVNGMPATLCLLHLYDVKKVIKEGLASLLLELQQYQDEYWHVALHRSSHAAGAMHARVDVVGAHELGLFHFGISEARLLMKVLEGAKNYPETCARIVSVGNGKALLAMYNAVIRPFMPQHTKDKILVLGRDIERPSCQEQIGFDDAAYATLLELTGRRAAPAAASAPAVAIS